MRTMGYRWDSGVQLGDSRLQCGDSGGQDSLGCRRWAGAGGMAGTLGYLLLGDSGGQPGDMGYPLG